MSDLIQKVEKQISEKLETYLAEGIEEDLFLKFCATNAIRTVLEEMLTYLGDQPPIGTFDNSKWINRINMVQAFARINNIPIGGENETTE